MHHHRIEHRVRKLGLFKDLSITAKSRRHATYASSRDMRAATYYTPTYTTVGCKCISLYSSANAGLSLFPLVVIRGIFSKET